MKDRSVKSIYYIVLAIGLIGLLSFFLRDFDLMKKYFFAIAILAIAIYATVKVFSRNSRWMKNREETIKYWKAVKQSRRKYGKSRIPHKRENLKTKPVYRRRRPSHLTVIEGNKHRKKVKNNQASH